MLDLELQKCKHVLKQKILRPVKFHGFEDSRKTLTRMMRRTVWDQESNSALLIGPPGSGKTTLVRSVLEDLQEDETFDRNALVVHLNGLVHTDDRLSLKSMSKQMNLENVIDEHVTGNFADNMVLLLSSLRLNDKAKALIFILEEADLFCTHHNQSLLYNLFDLAHSNENSVFVLGVTLRFDVVDRMEKRVRSRFSSRFIHLLPCNDANDLDEKISLCADLLHLDAGSMDQTFCMRWNQSVETLLAQDSPGYSCIKRLYNMENSEDTFKEFLLHVISKVSDDNPELKEEHFEKAFESVTSDGWLQKLDGLSILELCLVIAMKHLSDVYHGDPINFEMVFSRYLKFAKGHSNFEDSNRNTVIKAFEHLQSLELILPVNGQNKAQSQYQLYNFQLTPLQVKEAVKRYEDLPTEVQQWAEVNLV